MLISDIFESPVFSTVKRTELSLMWTSEWFGNAFGNIFREVCVFTIFYILRLCLFSMFHMWLQICLFYMFELS